jgi:hypothetical protein
VYRVADGEVTGIIAWIHRGRYGGGLVEGGEAI